MSNKKSLRSLKGGDQSDHPSIDVRIILKWIMEKWDGSMCAGFM
jgi:hypothetical protein